MTIDAFDARAGFFPRGAMPQGIFGLCKVTYDTRSGRRVEADRLTPDLMRSDVPASLEPGSDSWLDKHRTDVVVLGDAHVARPTRCSEVSVSVGRLHRRIAVFGDREVRWQGATPVFERPQPFMSMPITLDRAYGGVDARVDVDPAPNPAVADHPGLYPRNPYGKGYIVDPGPVRGLALPNLEDPAALLTPENLVVRDPARWFRQPIPVWFGYTPPNVFSRYAYLGASPWFPPPSDARLPEVAQGLLPAAFDRLAPEGPHPGFWQEAAPGLSVALEEGTPIVVRGMHPEGVTVRFTVPPPPRLELDLEGRCAQPVPHATKIELRPAEERATVTWLVRSDDMHRVFLPGIHREIPLHLRVDDTVVPYSTPTPVRAVLDEARARGTTPTAPRPRTPRG